MNYASAYFFELHYDEEAEKAKNCTGESCLHIKVFINDM
jgi:hypothetical protein